MSGILKIKRGPADVASLNDGEFYLNKGKNSVQIGSGSAILTLLPINRTITGDIILNGNVYANNLTGSGAISSSFTTTVSVGGIVSGTTLAAGTDFNQVFSQLLAPYLKPVLSNASLRNVSTDISLSNREVGSQFSFNKVIVTSSLENPGTLYAQNVSITASGTTVAYSAALGNLAVQNNEIALGSLITRQRNTTGSVVFTINGTSSTGQSLDPITITLPYFFSNYLCATSTTISTTSDAQSMIDDANSIVASSPVGSKNWIVNCDSKNDDSSKWTYIVYPYAYGDLESIVQSHTDVLTAFTKVFNTTTSTYEFNLQNSNGISSSYSIYKSNALGAFANNVKLTIS